MADFVFKIIVVGQAGVGKTSIVRRFIRKSFPENDRPTIGVDIGIKLIEINGVKIQLKIWDSAGAERFRSIATSYYRNADAAILVYGIDCLESLYDLQSWATEVNYHGNMLKILVGNKTDLEEERKTSQNMAIDFAMLQNIDLAIECSAKVDDNIDYLFHTMAKKLLVKHTTLYGHPKKGVNTNSEILKYNGVSKSMENLFQSPQQKQDGERIDPSGTVPKRSLFVRLCSIV
ncbi:ras-related protein Rab-30-like [Hydractinia symbiolongicarpus]|uniref:ras-related protein Rab-30-like n=1 Tax=Hydractinia symbiolongicarpus TaxID=13093 RepID=UPI00254FBBD0|nr:ras-related protein Rab-30-like [Hydractinia symbiolongicarpus]